MDIFDIVDCEKCESLRVYRARTHGDPNQCYPAEVVCLKDAPDSGPCERMLDAIHDAISGCGLETKDGQFYTQDILREYFPELALELSSVYYWMSNDGGIKAYKDVKEIFNAYFV